MLLDVDQNGTVSCDEFMEGCMRVNGDAKALSYKLRLLFLKAQLRCLLLNS